MNPGPPAPEAGALVLAELRAQPCWVVLCLVVYRRFSAGMPSVLSVFSSIVLIV